MAEKKLNKSLQSDKSISDISPQKGTGTKQGLKQAQSKKSIPSSEAIP